MSDRLVLDRWSGRDTELVQIDPVDGAPWLHRLLSGHTEPTDLWLHARLTPEQAADPTGLPDDVVELAAQLPAPIGLWIDAEPPPA